MPCNSYAPFAVSVALFLSASLFAKEPGLVAHYTFDDGSGSIVRDASGNGNDGTLHGATYVKVTKGHALEFDGDYDYVEIPTSESLEIEGPITVSVWVNARFANTGSLIAKNGCATIRQNYFIDLQDGGYRFETVECPTLEKSVSGPSISANEWHQIVGTFADGVLKVYTDGRLAGFRELDKFALGTDAEPLFIGARRYGSRDKEPGSFFTGQIDDVRIYDRALGEEEIRSQYETGKSARVSALTAMLSRMSAFEKIDTTPPTVNLAKPEPDVTVSAGATVSAKFSDLGSGIDTSSAKIILDGKDVTSSSEVTDRGFVLRSSAALSKKGVHKVEVTVSDRAGNLSNRMSWRFGVDALVEVVAKFEDGVFLLNGEPHFPMGIYAGSANPNNAHLPYMAQAGAAGVNYQLLAENTGPETLDLLMKHGMKALNAVGFGAMALGRGDSSSLENSLRLKDHPGLLGYWTDHQSETTKGALAATTRFVKERDSRHPILHMYTYGGRLGDAYYVYDYPILNPLRANPEKIELPALKPAFEAAAAEGKGKHVWYLSQAFDYRLSGNPDKIVTLPGGFRPSREEMRVMNYWALAQGVRGLLYYAPGVGIPGTPYVEDFAIRPRQWTEGLKIARELRHLARVIAAGEVAYTVRLRTGAPAVRYRQLSYDGLQTLIAVNITRENQLAEWVFESPSQPKVLFEDRALGGKSRAMADLHRPLEVHIYQWR